jgi:hypothetical protein
MQVPSLCSVCSAVARPAYTCRMCGLIVCAACFDKQSGTCELCSMKFGRRSGRPGARKAGKH